MKELRYLGIKGTGHIDKRYNREHTASFSFFECPVCLKEFELVTKRGKLQTTCKSCRGTQMVKHGMSNTPVYFAWQQMVQRCVNPKNAKYNIYGGKGISVDPKWITFEGFWEDMCENYKEGLTIDRVDSTKNYTKDNCQWLTKSDNSSKTSRKRAVVQLRKVLVPSVTFVEEKVWESALQAAEILGLVAGHISAVCLGKRQTHGGFGWKFVD
jgi:hypothetical protein